MRHTSFACRGTSMTLFIMMRYKKQLNSNYRGSTGCDMYFNSTLQHYQHMPCYIVLPIARYVYTCMNMIP